MGRHDVVRLSFLGQKLTCMLGTSLVIHDYGFRDEHRHGYHGSHDCSPGQDSWYRRVCNAVPVRSLLRLGIYGPYLGMLSSSLETLLYSRYSRYMVPRFFLWHTERRERDLRQHVFGCRHLSLLRSFLSRSPILAGEFTLFSPVSIWLSFLLPTSFYQR